MGWSSKINGNIMVDIKRTNNFFGPVKTIVVFLVISANLTKCTMEAEVEDNPGMIALWSES